MEIRPNGDGFRIYWVGIFNKEDILTVKVMFLGYLGTPDRPLQHGTVNTSSQF